MDQNGIEWIKIDYNVLEYIWMDSNGLKWIKMD